MINERHGDLFTTTAPLIAHGVNCRGAFGAGVAGQVAKRWPAVRQEYIGRHNEGIRNPRMEWRLGQCQLVRIDHSRWVANLATQEGFGRRRKGQVPHASLTGIATALNNLAYECEARRIDHVAMPRLGCGLGGLRWDEVRPVIAEWADRRGLVVEVWFQD